jgi:integrase
MKQDRSNLDFLDGPVWIEELNRWVVQIFYPDGSRIRKRFRREKDAKVFWGAQQKSIQDGSWRQEVERKAELTLDEAFEKYAAYSRVQHRSFRKFTEPALRFWKTDLGAHIPLSGVTTARIEEVRLREAKKRKPATVNKLIAVLRACFSWLEVQGLAKANPVRGRIKALKENNELVRYLSPAQFQQLIQEAAKVRWYLAPILIVAHQTGLRRGNILTLKWSDCDFDLRLIRISTSKNGEPIALGMDDTVYEQLKEIDKMRRVPDSDYVFAHHEGDQRGQPILDIKNAWKTATKNAGISNFRFHDLRHSCASLILMKTGNLMLVKDALAHKSIKSTLRYAHLSPEYMREQMKALDDSLPFVCRLKDAKAGKSKQNVIEISNTEKPVKARR